jgi:hypothetical protein
VTAEKTQRHSQAHRHRHSLSQSPTAVFDSIDAALETELRQNTVERDAFQAFADRVGEISVTTEAPDSVPPTIGVDTTGPSRLQAVRVAYEETVMATPHYKTEYGESYPVNLRAELGADVATAMLGARRLSRRHKHIVLGAVTDVLTARRQLIAGLDAEQASVDALREPVCTLVSDLDRLEAAIDRPMATDSARADYEPQLRDAYRRRLSVFEDRCHELIDRRQSEIVDLRHKLSLSVNQPDLPTYLYQELPADHPVVATLTACLNVRASVWPRSSRPVTASRTPDWTRVTGTAPASRGAC